MVDGHVGTLDPTLVNDMMLKNLLEKVRKMRDGSEMLLGEKAIITRMDEKEWKISPHGHHEDYDLDCYWIFEDELESELACYLADSELLQSNS